MCTPKKYQKTTDIIHKFNPNGSRGHPFIVFFLPFCCLFFYSHYKSDIFIISSNMSLRIFIGMGYNQHAHTHFSGIIRSE